MINKLYKQYHRDAGITEKHTQQEMEQQFEFVALLGESPIFHKLHEFLFCRGMLSVRLTGVFAHWQKVRDCFLNVIVPDRLCLYECLCGSICDSEGRPGMMRVYGASRYFVVSNSYKAAYEIIGPFKTHTDVSG